MDDVANLVASLDLSDHILGLLRSARMTSLGRSRNTSGSNERFASDVLEIAKVTGRDPAVISDLVLVRRTAVGGAARDLRLEIATPSDFSVTDTVESKTAHEKIARTHPAIAPPPVHDRPLPKTRVTAAQKTKRVLDALSEITGEDLENASLRQVEAARKKKWILRLSRILDNCRIT